MKDKDIEKKSPKNQETDDKIHVSQSVFQTAKEIQQKRLTEMEEQQRKIDNEIAQREKKKREAYERRLFEEKKELIRIKQGQVEESKMIHEEPEEVIVLSPWKKITNFFYHNKWWLGFGVFFVLVGVFLIYDLVTKDRPDLVVLVVADNEYVGNSALIEDYIEGFADDFNGNGEVLVSVYYIPFSENNSYQNYATGTDTKLTVEFQSAEAMIVIGDDKITDILDPDSVFVDLEELYPDNPCIDGTAFELADTGFAEKIGISESVLGDDLFISFRKPQKLLYTDEEEMQETYDKDFPVFERIISDLSQD